MEVLNKFFEWLKSKQRDNDRDLEYYETEFYYFLSFIFVKKSVHESVIKKKRRLSDEKFEDFRKFAMNKKFIKPTYGSYPTGASYHITELGTDYLLKYKGIIVPAVYSVPLGGYEIEVSLQFDGIVVISTPDAISNLNKIAKDIPSKIKLTKKTDECMFL